MNYLYLFGSIALYMASMGVTFGYFMKVLGGYDNAPESFMAALFWPVVISYMIFAMPFHKLGKLLAEKLLARQEQQEVIKLEKLQAARKIKEKIRIELQAAEEELEHDMEEDYDSPSVTTR